MLSKIWMLLKNELPVPAKLGAAKREEELPVVVGDATFSKVSLEAT